MFFTLALKSLLDRRASVVLAIIAMTISLVVLLTVEQIRHQAKDSFASTVSGVDLIVGARTGHLNLLMYSIFRIGTPTNNIRWETYQAFADHELVDWTIPLSLGDSHQGFRVLGTTQDYFRYYQYGQQRTLTFSAGHVFRQTLDVVLGADVARQLNYQPGDTLVLAHGIGRTSFSQHSDQPFTVTGILAPTGTPVDQTLHVSLQGIEAIHANGQWSAQKTNFDIDLKPEITAFMVGVTSKLSIFSLQRSINNYTDEPLSAILPGVTLTELWQAMSLLEDTLRIISILVFVAACLGVSAMLLSSMRERREELRLLRAIGASPAYLFWLIELEALLITLFSCVAAGLLLMLGFTIAENYFLSAGLVLEFSLLDLNTLKLLAIIVFISASVAAIPSIQSYRQSVAIQ